MTKELFNIPVLPAENEPLFTFDLYDAANIDHVTGETFYLCVITKWNNKTINAREIAHKSFYINGVFADIRAFFEKIKDNDADFLKIYEKPQYTRLYITKSENYTVKF